MAQESVLWPVIFTFLQQVLSKKGIETSKHYPTLKKVVNLLKDTLKAFDNFKNKQKMYEAMFFEM